MLKKIILIFFTISFIHITTSCYIFDFVFNDNQSSDELDINMLADEFRLEHINALGLTENTVTTEHMDIVIYALERFNYLIPSVQVILDVEYQLLNNLLDRIIYLEYWASDITVTFVNNNNQDDSIITIRRGETVTRPNNPQLTDYIFYGWFTCNSFIEKFNFSNHIITDIRLYARFSDDFEYVVRSLKWNATIGLNIRRVNNVNAIINTGSGFNFHRTYNLDGSRYYYVLTNYHVINDREDRTTEVRLDDYRGVRHYNATIIHKYRNYDLAVVRFRRNANTDLLGLIEKEYSRAAVGSQIAILARNGTAAGINIGNVTRFFNTFYIWGVTVLHGAMASTAHSAGGASGGAVLNTDLRLIGVHAAGSNASANHPREAVAVPIDTVHRYLNTHIWHLIR